jgi:hypothetical protein
MKKISACVLAVLVTAGCADFSRTPPGTVVETSRRAVTVKNDGTGVLVTYDTSKAVARRCHYHPRWPDCT